MCRKVILLISLAQMLEVAGSASADLVAHWRLDETSGTTAYDSSGNRNDGTLNGNPQWAAGMIGGALHFDGSSDYVRIPFSESLRVLNRGDFTFTLWLNADEIDKKHIILQQMDLNGLGRSWLTIGNGNADNAIRTFVGGAWTVSGFIIDVGEWYHAAVVVTEGGAADSIQIYVNGKPEGNPRQDSMEDCEGDFLIGCSKTFGTFTDGLVDDVRIYSQAMTEEDLQVVMEGIEGGFPSAMRPTPADGSQYEQTWARLSWRAGDSAVSHDLYFGTDFDDVNEGAEGTFVGNIMANSQVVGFPSFPAPEGLQPGATYYWRVDEVNDLHPDSPWKSKVWSFWIPPKNAHDASPVDGAIFADPNVDLSWTLGLKAVMSAMYFGTSADEVANAVGAPPVMEEGTFDPGPLASDTTYYWRVDMFDGVQWTKGDIWSFTTVPDIPISDPDLVAWWKLDEGGGTTVVDWSGHGNHGTFNGDPAWTDGYEAGALDLDGTGDYVDFADTSDLPAGTSARTMCGWGKTNTIAGGWRWIAAYGTGATSQAMFIGINGDDLYGGGYGDEVLLSDFWQVGIWHHICLTYDGTTATLYADGMQVASESKTWDLTLSRAHIGRQVNNAAEFWNGLVDDVRIYDKALTAEEIRQVMLGNTKLAGSPVPDRDALLDIRDIGSLSWSRGDTAASHDVYFGHDRDAVAGADNNSPQFQGNQTGTSLSLADLVEFGGGDYYWRIDEVEADGTVNAGTIWKFTVPDYLIVDNFESYDNIDPAPGEPGINRIFDKWIDGYGTLTNGALVGNDLPPYAETSVVHGGAQSMVYRYDNAGKTSEATLTLDKRDWTAAGATKLSLWLRGDSANAADRVYVALNSTAVVYHDEPAATQLTGWKEWVVDLSAFGVGLTNGNSITIGIGTKGSPAAGGAGRMYFDDIRLVR